ncbi:MAG: ComEC/Rec2 family competence protein [Oryzihumus sp.]
MSEDRPDLRTVLLGAAGWAGGVAVLGLPGRVLTTVVLVGAVLLLLRRRRRRGVRTAVACVLVAVAVGAVTLLRVEAMRAGAVGTLARSGAYVHLTARVVSDPAVHAGRHGPFTTTRLTVTAVSDGDRTWRTRVPVLALGDVAWANVALGSLVETSGRLGPADGADLAATLAVRSRPRVLARPRALLDGAAAVRSATVAALARAGPDERALVPALVTGDDAAMSDAVVADFRTCGLTHLAAVSGTNLTLVVGFLLLVARWAGVRARGLLLVGGLGVLGFVLLARPEPSVLRAAVMGSVALLGMGARGRERGSRALGVAVLVLLLVDPFLAVSWGFALSVAATAGILFLAPPLRDALMGWLPRWAAEALAVPFAAQLACTPLVAALSGQVSLVAVLANLLVEPAVAPATVLGLLAGLVMLVLPAVALVLGWTAGLCAGWIVAVATRLARLPGAAVDGGGGAAALGALTLLCLALAVLAPRLLARRGRTVALCLVLVVVMARPLPTPGWPPRGWVLVACDVGQGDGLVLAAGPGRGVVVDTGPEPDLMRACLRRLGVREVPVLVLTHFHADHVDGLPAVLAATRVRELDVTATRVPASGAAQVDRWARAAAVPVRVPPVGESRTIGPLTWQVIGPVRPPPEDDGEEGTVANDASLVLLVRTHGLTILMAGDMEPGAQAQVDRMLPGLHVDVLKVPHHGSRYQDPDLLDGLGARLAVVSVGAVNDYGHPAAATLALLHDAGMMVRRTDLDGDVAVVVDGGRLSVATRH